MEKFPCCGKLMAKWNTRTSRKQLLPVPTGSVATSGVHRKHHYIRCPPEASLHLVPTKVRLHPVSTGSITTSVAHRKHSYIRCPKEAWLHPVSTGCASADYSKHWLVFRHQKILNTTWNPHCGENNSPVFFLKGSTSLYWGRGNSFVQGTNSCLTFYSFIGTMTCFMSGQGLFILKH